ncbi:MAG: N-acetylmuramoyl-L-alanine amidase [Acidobacteriota bacterium]
MTRIPRRALAAAAATTASLLLAGCTSLPMVDVPSANQNSRIQYLVIHFTTVPFGTSMELLTERTDRPVSTHYLIPEPDDATYPDRELKIYRLVPEARRAWHAGRSTWGRKQSLNDSSLGIELVNLSTCRSLEPDAERQTLDLQRCDLLPFSDRQIELTIDLILDILKRHPEIDPVDVVAHSDIAPTRRFDPGPLFPWKELHDRGIGAWYDGAVAERYRRRFADEMPSRDALRRAFGAYGYTVDAQPRASLTEDDILAYVVYAFQSHFRQSRVDGRVDAETAGILWALIEKYRPRALADLDGTPE